MINSFLLSREVTCTRPTIVLYRYYLTDYAARGQPFTELGINEYLRSLVQDGKANDTVRNAYRIIKTACRWWFDHGMIPANPFDGVCRVRPPAKRRKRIITYSDEDIRRLLHAPSPLATNKRTNKERKRWSVDGPLMREAQQARCLVLLLVDSGMRAGEVCGLTCGQIRAAELVIESKGGHTDVAFISRIVRDELLLLAGDRPDSDPLFRHWHGAAPTTEALRNLLVRLADRAGVILPDRPLHAFRHYAARNWVKAGLNDLLIQQLMRHSELSTTQMYTGGIDPDELSKLHEAASALPRLEMVT